MSTLPTEGIRALVVQNDPAFDALRNQLVPLVSKYATPAIYHIREFPMIGGLMSYGPSLLEAYHRLGIHTGRVLKESSPSEIPVTEPTNFELVINSKTAGKLGLEVPVSLLARADEVIE